MIAGEKCENCLTDDAVVYLATVDWQGHPSKRKYCKKCAIQERVKVMLNSEQKSSPNIKIKMQQDLFTDKSVSPLDLIQKIMEKEYSKNKKNITKNPSQTALLEKALAEAVSKEDYEKAASIRDEINIINQLSDNS